MGRKCELQISHTPRFICKNIFAEKYGINRRNFSMLVCNTQHRVSYKFHNRGLIDEAYFIACEKKQSEVREYLIQKYFDAKVGVKKQWRAAIGVKHQQTMTKIFDLLFSGNDNSIMSAPTIGVRRYALYNLLKGEDNETITSTTTTI
jgi:hypothetical protein